MEIPQGRQLRHPDADTADGSDSFVPVQLVRRRNDVVGITLFFKPLGNLSPSITVVAIRDAAGHKACFPLANHPLTDRYFAVHLTPRDVSPLARHLRETMLPGEQIAMREAQVSDIIEAAELAMAPAVQAAGAGFRGWE